MYTFIEPKPIASVNEVYNFKKCNPRGSSIYSLFYNATRYDARMQVVAML